MVEARLHWWLHHRWTEVDRIERDLEFVVFEVHRWESYALRELLCPRLRRSCLKAVLDLLRLWDHLSPRHPCGYCLFWPWPCYRGSIVLRRLIGDERSLDVAFQDISRSTSLTLAGLISFLFLSMGFQGPRKDWGDRRKGISLLLTSRCRVT